MLMKLVLLHEPAGWGHHPFYACLLSEGFLRLGNLTCVVCANPKEVKGWLKEAIGPNCLNNVLLIKALSADSGSKVFFKDILDTALKRKVIKWFELKYYVIVTELHFRKKVDLIFLGMMDDYISSKFPIHVLDFIIRRNWMGLLIFPKTKDLGLTFDLSYLSVLNRSAFFKCLFCLNENIIPRLKSLLTKPIYHFPDFSHRFSKDKIALYPKIRKLAGSRKIIGLFGVLDFRKGIMDLLDFAASSYGRSFYFFVCGTSYDKRSKSQVDTFETKLHFMHLNNVFYRNTNIPFRHFDEYLNSVDAIWLCYKDFPFSSNVLTRASLCRKPVVCVTGALIARRVTNFNLGAVSSGFSPIALNHAFSRAFQRKNERGFSKYSDYHSLKSFLHTFSFLSGSL